MILLVVIIFTIYVFENYTRYVTRNQIELRNGYLYYIISDFAIIPWQPNIRRFCPNCRL